MPLTKVIKSSHEDQNRKLNYLKRHPITLRFGDSSLEGLFLQEVAKSRLPVFIAIAAFDGTLFAFRKIFKTILWAGAGADSVGISSTWWTVLGQGFNLVVLHALIATIHFFSHSSASAASKGELLLAALISCILCILVTSPLASAQWVIIAFFLICTSTLLRLRWYIGSIAFSVPVALATAVSTTLRSKGHLPLLVPGLEVLEPLPPNSIIHLSIAWAVGTLMGYLSDESRRTAFANHRRAVVAVKTELEQMEARLAAEQNLSAVQALAQAKSLLVERERAANEAKSEFISMLCHEIRTPLSGCLASAEMLLECDLSPEQRDLAQTVRISGSILLSTVSNFLDYFKLEAGKSLDIIRTPFDISTLVGDVHRIIEAMVGADKNVDLVSPELKRIPPSVVGDPARVCGILLNMYVNAAKFTREGSIRLIVHAVNKQYRPRPTFSNECYNGSLSGPGPTSISSPSIECQTKSDSTPGVNITVREEHDGWMAAESDIKCEVGSSVGDVNECDTDTCWVAFEVHDTGIGITPKSLRALFRDYVQGDEQEEQQKDNKVAGKRQSGTGLGLAICSRQVALLGGALGALSKPGSGSVFWFKIPMKLNNRPAEHVSDCCRGPSSDVAAQPPVVSQRQDQPTPCLKDTEVSKEGGKDQRVTNSDKTSTQEMMDDDANNKNGRPPLANVRVLLVEDNMINRKVTSHVLRSLGGFCETASNGQEAIDLVGENAVSRWDIILMDMCMPVLGGVDATRRLRELGCRIPIVAMTANASNKDKEECLSAGMDGFLSKPVLRNELAQCIYKHIQLGSRASSGSSDSWTWS